MSGLSEQFLSCPCCGEPISMLIDRSLPEQRYTEDCQVCCRPIVVAVLVNVDGEAVVTLSAEND